MPGHKVACWRCMAGVAALRGLREREKEPAEDLAESYTRPWLGHRSLQG